MKGKVVLRYVALTIVSCLVLGAILWTEFVQGQSATPEQIVEQFYPQVLIDRASAHPGVPLSRQSAFAVYERFLDGAPRTIIAAYSNGVEGAIRVLQVQTGTSFTVVFESLGIGDANPSVELADVDADGTNEVIVKTISFTGITTSFVFRYDRGTLLSIGPSDALSNADLVDLDHDGTLAIASLEEPRPSAEADNVREGGYRIYKLWGGRYVLAQRLLYLAPFVRHKGTPETITETFALFGDSTGPYVLRLVNGERGGGRRVSSARIVLNGIEVLSPDNFSQQVEFLSLPVTLLPRNTIEVTLAGEPLGEIFVTVEDTSKTPPSQ